MRFAVAARLLGVVVLSSALLLPISGLSATRALAVDTHRCVSTGPSTWPCLNLQSVQYIGPNTQVCPPGPNGEEWYTATDGFGVPIDYTYSNGSVGCVRATYSWPGGGGITGGNCDYYFYVPSGHATANVIFGWWDPSGTKHYFNALNENPVEGWTYVGTINAALVTLNFQDNNGQTSGQIGWGTPAGYGFEVRNCR